LNQLLAPAVHPSRSREVIGPSSQGIATEPLEAHVWSIGAMIRQFMAQTGSCQLMAKELVLFTTTRGTLDDADHPALVRLVFNPTRPHRDAGIRTEPPVSVPRDP
jgi:hypothetical protein